MRMSLFVAFVVILSGCTIVPDKPWQPMHVQEQVGSDYGSTLLVIEASEKGHFFEDEQFEKAKSWLAEDHNSDPLLIFVNGWHHNAETDDGNLQSFRSLVADVEQVAAERLKGLYVGWRGDSVDILNLPEPVDFLTIWGRKGASRKVGEDAIKQLLDHLRATHPDRRVIIMGHSLGGSALFHALKSNLGDTFEDSYEYILLNPAASDKEFREVEEDFEKRLNLQLQTTGEKTSVSHIATIRDHRKLTVFQALGDRAVGFFYRIAFLGSTPVGFKEKRISHHAFICEDGGECGASDDTCYNYLAGGKFVIKTRISETESCNEINRRPIWVVAGQDSVSKGHNDIFNGVQKDALADLIGRRFSR